MSNQKKLFGTDGIRGVANRYPMTPEMAMRTGTAVAQFVKKQGEKTVVIGKDTRLSGDMLEAALAAGIASEGVNVLSAGIIPTPGVAFLSSDIEGVGAGIVISASHNPWQDNGIKIFKKGGHKLTDEEEATIEALIMENGPKALNLSEPGAPGASQTNGTETEAVHISHTGTIAPLPDASQQYCDFLQNTLDVSPKEEKIKVVVDCSNGASFRVAPLLFRAPIFDADFIFHHPDGKNINENCGSQHTQSLEKCVVEKGAALGLAFDGDADRLIAVDETGKAVTGDAILLICAAHAKSKGKLANNRVVSTVMSNIGLVRALKSFEIEHLITGVGDREVLKEMQCSGAVMGGEDSGHMIFSQYHTTGDGLLTALRLIEVMMETGTPLSELAAVMKVYPQVLMNVEVDSSRPDFMAISPIADEIDFVESELGDDGRVLVRYSGTQPLLRVMVEGPDQETTERCCRRICEAIKSSIAA